MEGAKSNTGKFLKAGQQRAEAVTQWRWHAAVPKKDGRWCHPFGPMTSVSGAASNNHQLSRWLLPRSNLQATSCHLTISDVFQGVLVSDHCCNK